MGRPRNVANGAVPPFAAIEAARAPPGLESRNPHFAYNKTIPYRFISVNGKTAWSTFDAATRTFVSISPAGRESRAVLDAQGHIARVETGGALPAE